MKIDRLIGILSILLQQEKVTAPYLADKYEVSRRTINRDIEALCKAGIPLVTTQGKNGGISIMDGYRMDKTLLTSADMQAIMAGLKSLDSVSKTSRYQQLMEKLNPGTSSLLPGDSHILIDLSSWYKGTLTPKIESIQEAIQRETLLSFTYFGPKGEGIRTIEPYYLVFQWTSWYVWGYCTTRKDFRLFKLNRMTDLYLSQPFRPRAAPYPDFTPQQIYPPALSVTIRISPLMKWRLIEEYGLHSFEELPDGTLLFRNSFPDEESIFSWLLSFGDQGEILEPPKLRSRYRELLERMLLKHSEET